MSPALDASMGKIDEQLPTLNCALLVQLGTQHFEAEEEDCDREQNSDAEANSPDCREVVFSGGGKYNQKHRNRKRTAELAKAS